MGNKQLGFVGLFEWLPAATAVGLASLGATVVPPSVESERKRTRLFGIAGMDLVWVWIWGEIWVFHAAKRGIRRNGS